MAYAIPCPACDGTGKELEHYEGQDDTGRWETGLVPTQWTCTECDGLGVFFVDDEPKA